MILVEKIYESIRQEGLNYGLPMTFVTLGPGPSYTPDDLVRDVITTTRCAWTCILGDGTTQVGMGSLVRGLVAVNLKVELETRADVRDPGWLSAVDRWVVDYCEDAMFNLGALRSNDMIRFAVSNEEDLEIAKQAFPRLKLFGGTRYVVVPASLLGTHVFNGVYSLVRAFDRARIYVRGE